MKTFKELIFKDHAISKDSLLFNGHKQAMLNFDNGYGVSVLFGKSFYSNGVDTFELAVLKDGKLCFDTHITNEVVGYINSDKVTELMKLIQKL